MHGRDDRQRETLDGRDCAQELRDELFVLRGEMLSHVGPHREVLALGREEEHAEGGLLGEPLQRLAQVGQHLAGQDVQRGVIQDDPAQTLLHRRANGHRSPPPSGSTLSGSPSSV